MLGLENQLEAKKYLLYCRKQYSFDSILIIRQIRFPFHQRNYGSHPPCFCRHFKGTRTNINRWKEQDYNHSQTSAFCCVLYLLLNDLWEGQNHTCACVLNLFWQKVNKSKKIKKVRILFLYVLLLAKCHIRCYWHSDIMFSVFFRGNTYPSWIWPNETCPGGTSATAAVPSLLVACSWLERADKDRAAGSRIDFKRQRIDQPQPVRVASVDTLQPLLVPLPSRRNGSVELLHSCENRELGSYSLKFFPASNFHSFIPRSLGKVSDIRISCLASANLTSVHIWATSSHKLLPNSLYILYTWPHNPAVLSVLPAHLGSQFSWENCHRRSVMTPS